jgi:glyoxylate reductase
MQAFAHVILSSSNIAAKFLCERGGELLSFQAIVNTFQRESMAPYRVLVISDSFHTLPEAVEVLAASGHNVSYVKDLISWSKLEEDNRDALQHADALVMGRVLGIEREHFSLAPNLKVIALHTSGSDNIDIAAATQRGVLVTNVKGVNAEQCAEFAMGLMLCVVRQIRTGDIAIRAGLWASRTQTSIDVFGATLGVVGLGQIAQAFVRRAQAFGMKILVYTRTQDDAAARRHGIAYATLDELLMRSDIVCLFASLNNQTTHMIGERELKLMKRSAYLINIARGELIDESSLLDALREGRIAGAGLDVFEGEPITSSPFFQLENVVLTPHQAGLTQGGKVGAAVRAARNALAVLNGDVPTDAVNPAAGPNARRE